MDMREINKGIISEFRANAGVLSGPMAGAPIALLTTAGRKSGAMHTTPVGFMDISGRLVIAAANGGSDTDPDWSQNLMNNPDATLEVGNSSVEVTATVAGGEERQDLLDELASGLPGMVDHIAATTREIPVIVLSEKK